MAKSLFCVMIAEEVGYVVSVFLDLNWYGTIVSWSDFQCRIDDCEVVMVLIVSGVGQE